MRKMNGKSQFGFHLIEIMVVISVISLLAVFAIHNFKNAKKASMKKGEAMNVVRMNVEAAQKEFTNGAQYFAIPQDRQSKWYYFVDRGYGESVWSSIDDFVRLSQATHRPTILVVYAVNSPVRLSSGLDEQVKNIIAKAGLTNGYLVLVQNHTNFPSQQ